ncbi:MAG: hypothetical protein IPP37_21270 [Saprospiraceae bacterium]|nr:hypothetical protein [Saprospiraceae bacterium]
MELTWFDHLFFFVIGVVFPTMAIMTEKPGNEEDMDMSYLPPKKHIYYTNGLMLLIGSLMVLTLWNVTYRSFEKLGFHDIMINPTALWIVVAISLIYIVDTVYNVIQNKKTLKNGRTYLISCHLPGLTIAILFFWPLQPASVKRSFSGALWSIMCSK